MDQRSRDARGDDSGGGDSSEVLQSTLARVRERCRRVSEMCMQVVRRVPEEESGEVELDPLPDRDDADRR